MKLHISLGILVLYALTLETVYAVSLTIKNLLNRPVLIQAFYSTLQMNAGFNLPAEKIGGAFDDQEQLNKLQEGERFSLAPGQQHTLQDDFKTLASLQWTYRDDNNSTITWQVGLNTNKNNGEFTIRSDGNGLYDWKKDRYHKPLIKQKATKVQIAAIPTADFDHVIIKHTI